MTITNQTDNQANRRRRGCGAIAFYGTALVLVIAIVASAVQVVGVYWQSTQQANTYVERQGAYEATATALAPAANDGASLQWIAQFATNTPEAPTQAPIFPTNTPPATDLPPMQSATPSPNVAATSVILPTFVPNVFPDSGEIAGMAVPPKAPIVPRDYDLVNIVLLGGDEDIVGDNTTRTDSIIIVSINTETGSVSMLSLPRDLFVLIPTPTMTRINTVYDIGENFGWDGGGFGLLRQTIFHNLGIQVHYYARIDISGLAELIDTIGGVEIAVDCNYQDYALIGAEVPADAIGPDEDGAYILPVGYYRFSGDEALWYARTRGNSDDFDRGRRQQELLRAIFRAARDNGQIAQIPQLWNELTQVVETDIPFDVAAGLVPIALNLQASQIETFALIRTVHTTPWTPNVGVFAQQNVQLINPEPTFDLLRDFYTPPPASRLSLASARIAVYNGTDQANLDLVASERLRSEGFNAYAAGYADQRDYTQTTLIDYAAQDRGSPIGIIMDALNINSSAVTVQPNPERTVDYEVIVGSGYDSCEGSVVPLEP